MGRLPRWMGPLAISALLILAVGAWAATGSAAAAGTAGPFASVHPLATTTNSTATNWAGYAILPSSGGGVTDVKASWNVPKIVGSCPSTDRDSDVFVGIDGAYTGATTAEITWTSSDCSSGSPVYGAFYQFYPTTGAVSTGLTIHAGDHMHGEVKFNTTSKKFTATLKDLSTGKSFKVTKAVAGAARNSAEWIVSGEFVGTTLLPLADFGSVVFTNASATISGHTHSISGFNNFAITMWNLAGTKVKASVGALQSSGTKFKVTWKSAGP